MSMDKGTIAIRLTSLNAELLKNLFESFDTRERQDFLHFVQCAIYYGSIEKSAAKKFSIYEPKGT